MHPKILQAKGRIGRFKKTFNEEYLVLQNVFEGIEKYLPKWIHYYKSTRTWG